MAVSLDARRIGAAPRASPGAGGVEQRRAESARRSEGIGHRSDQSTPVEALGARGLAPPHAPAARPPGEARLGAELPRRPGGAGRHRPRRAARSGVGGGGARCRPGPSDAGGPRHGGPGGGGGARPGHGRRARGHASRTAHGARRRRGPARPRLGGRRAAADPGGEPALPPHLVHPLRGAGAAPGSARPASSPSRRRWPSGWPRGRARAVEASSPCCSASGSTRASSARCPRDSSILPRRWTRQCSCSSTGPCRGRR